MSDLKFEHPRLVAVYDAFEGERRDLDAYVAIVSELGARRVLDVGCGTGVLALRLAASGAEVIGVDPAAGSLAMAQARPGAERVRWVLGTAAGLPSLDADVALMTGNVAQAIVAPDDWDATLSGIHGSLRPGGHLVFETRVPARRAWEAWSRERDFQQVDLPGVGIVQTWTDLVSVDGPLVTFRSTYVFADDGAEFISESTLRFRERGEVEATLHEHGFAVDDVRDAPDRPGLEYVFVLSKGQ